MPRDGKKDQKVDVAPPMRRDGSQHKSQFEETRPSPLFDSAYFGPIKWRATARLAAAYSRLLQEIEGAHHGLQGLDNAILARKKALRMLTDADRISAADAAKLENTYLQGQRNLEVAKFKIGTRGNEGERRQREFIQEIGEKELAERWQKVACKPEEIIEAESEMRQWFAAVQADEIRGSGGEAQVTDEQRKMLQDLETRLGDEVLRMRMEAELSAAGLLGDDALEEAALVSAKKYSDLAARTASAAQAAAHTSLAGHAIKVALQRLPDRWRLQLAGANMCLAQSLRLAGRKTRLQFLANAESMYEDVLKLRPDYADAHGNMGIVHANLGDLQPSRAGKLKAYTQAENCYRRVLELQPNHAGTLGNLGVLLKTRGDLEPSQTTRLKTYTWAEICYRRVLELQPNHAGTLGNLGVLLKTRGDLAQDRGQRLKIYEEAERIWRRVLELQPEQLETLGNLGVLLKKRGDLEQDRGQRLKDYEEAERVYRRVLELQPNHVATLGNLGNLLAGFGELSQEETERLKVYRRAEEIYRQALKISPADVPLWKNLSLTLKACADSEVDEAIKEANRQEFDIISQKIVELSED